MKSGKFFVVMLLLLMGATVGNSSPPNESFKECFVQCLATCCVAIDEEECLPVCAPACGVFCIPWKPSPSSEKQIFPNYCELNCASSNCYNISTLHNPRADEVEGCLNTCSGNCTK
ncbi:hypothetical protein MKW94_017284 [Papaver nudicaule]|uniref:Thionin-like protein 2 n=1 Tax=Papaver nudicaule TaxID=74823 RepID=A0AA41UYI6_PAPNU|nr:hypothetical protein [Papaver nudicaule]